MKRQCKYCNHCKEHGRSRAQGIEAFGRKHYYCEHPGRNNDKSMEIHDFVGYGDNTRQSPLKLKTHPKWCPMEVKHEAD